MKITHERESLPCVRDATVSAVPRSGVAPGTSPRTSKPHGPRLPKR